MATHEPSPEEEMVRLLVAQLRLQLGTQSQTIVELDRAGFGQSRIAQLLGTTSGTVNQALLRAKKPRTRRAEGESND